MSNARTDALNAVLDDLDKFEIDLNVYYDDAEPQGVIDRVLSGKIASLRAFCQLFGWSELVAHLRNMTPLKGDAVEFLESIRAFVIPEARKLLADTNVENLASPTQWFWQLIHPRICALARPRFEAGFFADAVEASFKELNDTIKRIVRDGDGRELDGAGLMTTAFSPQAPIIRLTALATETDKSIQQGYMQI
jgi:Protein of unknown function (Hypoth_ymh)